MSTFVSAYNLHEHSYAPTHHTPPKHPWRITLHLCQHNIHDAICCYMSMPDNNAFLSAYSYMTVIIPHPPPARSTSQRKRKKSEKIGSGFPPAKTDISFGDVKQNQTNILALPGFDWKRAWCAFLSGPQPKGARLNTLPWHLGRMDWGLTNSLGSFVRCRLSLEFIWPVPWGIWRWTRKLWRQWRWMVGTCTNIVWTLPVPAWHACGISISSQWDESTVENQVVKLR